MTLTSFVMQNSIFVSVEIKPKMFPVTISHHSPVLTNSWSGQQSLCLYHMHVSVEWWRAETKYQSPSLVASQYIASKRCLYRWLAQHNLHWLLPLLRLEFVGFADKNTDPSPINHFVDTRKVRAATKLSHCVLKAHSACIADLWFRIFRMVEVVGLLLSWLFWYALLSFRTSIGSKIDAQKHTFIWLSTFFHSVQFIIHVFDARAFRGFQLNVHSPKVWSSSQTRSLIAAIPC